jgi:hypothetical protein
MGVTGRRHGMVEFFLNRKTGSIDPVGLQIIGWVSKKECCGEVK